jgi:hypothetical protein
MNIQTHTVSGVKIAEVLVEDVVINSAEDGLDLLANLYYQEYDKIIIYEKNITPLFFDLKNGMAGELLQKFSNYRIPLAIVGSFTAYSSKSLKDFMYESNQRGHISFVPALDDALQILTRKRY